MDYFKLYEVLVTRAKGREQKEGQYYEKHHIWPRSFGEFLDDNINLVALTGREHFICHVLLAKIFNKTSIVHAPFKMACHNDGRYGKITSRMYESLRAAHAKRVSEDTEASAKKGRPGRKQTPEHILARTEARKAKGKWFQDENISEKISKGLVGIKHPNRKKGNERSDDEKEGATQSGLTRRGRKMLPEQVAKSVASRRGKPRIVVLSDERVSNLKTEKSQKVICPHCGKEGQCMVMYRWHFDNCRTKP